MWLCPIGTCFEVELVRVHQARMSSDLVGVWEVALSDGVHRIEFEHGTTTGKRVVCIDGKVKLLVSEFFQQWYQSALV